VASDTGGWHYHEMNERAATKDLDLPGLLSGLAAYLWWGLSALYWQALGAVGALDVIAHRAFWAVPFCALLLAWRGHLRRAFGALASTRNVALLLLTSALVAVNWWLFVWAVKTGQLTEASLGYFMQPLCTVLIGLLFFRERLRPVEWLALGFALAGVAVFALGVGKLPLLAMAIAVSFALYGALRKQLPVDSIDGLFIETLLIAPAALGWILWHDGAGLGQFDRTTDLLLVLAGVFTALPLIAYVNSARRLPLVTLGLLFYINPSCQLLLAVFWFGESVDASRLWAFGLVWSGLALYLAHMLQRWRRSRPL
jgi:chloramphenicol-sensitive protein RarD